MPGKRGQKHDRRSFYSRALVLAGVVLLVVLGPKPPAPLPREATAEAWLIAVPLADVRREPDPGSELVTQALYGSTLKVLGKRQGWLQVMVEIQGDYPGFVREDQAIRVALSEGARWLVVEPVAAVYDSPGDSGRAVLNFYAGSSVTVLKGVTVLKENEWLEVEVPPLGKGWMKRGSLRQGVEVAVSGQGLLETARRFVGVPYRWGGTSVEGIDCSGLTYIVCLVNGVYIPRDADAQFQYLKEHRVAKQDLKPGDLVFFSTNGKFATHVGFYEGNGRFLSALSSTGKVVSDRLDSAYWSRYYFGAARPY